MTVLLLPHSVSQISLHSLRCILDQIEFVPDFILFIATWRLECFTVAADAVGHISHVFNIHHASALVSAELLVYFGSKHVHSIIVK